MDANRQPGIELARIFLNQVHFSHRLPATSGDTKPYPTGDLQLEVSVSESADRKAALILVRLKTEPSDSESPYEFDIEFGGVARTVEGEDNLPPSEYLERLGVPMMFPFIREFLANLSLRARNGAVWLRPINLAVLGKLSTSSARPALRHGAAGRRKAKTPRQGGSRG